MTSVYEYARFCRKHEIDVAACEAFVEGAVDFTVSGWRFIHKDIIDDVLLEALRDDFYMLGCFNSWCIAEVTGLPQDVIDTLQKAGAYEGIGKLILAMCKLEEFCAEYVRHEGYGDYFAHYKGEEYTIGNYYAFCEEERI